MRPFVQASARLALAATLVASCGGGNGSRADAAADTMPNADGVAKIGCALESPDELPRSPTGVLPCDLVPPGLTL